jgi:hypothetical protein
VGPTQACSTKAGCQGVGPRTPRSPGLRLCLLKGCGRWFTARHPCERYCGEGCAKEARKWRRWRDQIHYRATERGKAMRREQSRRWRARQKRRVEKDKTVDCGAPPLPSNDKPVPGCEGHPYSLSGNFFPCDRPGCYTLFVKTTRSPLRRFCSSACRKALRHARLREARWRRARMCIPRKALPTSSRQVAFV